MIALSESTHLLKIVTASAVSLDVVVTYSTPANLLKSDAFNITTATTTNVLAGSANENDWKKVLSVVIRNRHASSSQTVYVVYYDGATDFRVTPDMVVNAGETATIDEFGVPRLADTSGYVGR